MKDTHTLEGDSIHFSFGQRKILSGVYIQLQTGQVTGLLGRNGSGKSTLLNVLFGELRSADGTVRWNAGYVRKPYLVRDLVAYMPQKPCFPERLTFNKALSLFGADTEQVAEAVEACGVTSRVATQPLGQLSLGERKLLEVLLFLNCRHRFLLLDEPFSFLSPVQVQMLKPLIAATAKQKGILVTDHRYEEVLDLSHKIYLLREASLWPITSRKDLSQHGYIR